MEPTIPDGRYGEATPHVRAAYARIRALTPGESFFHPCRDSSVAEALVREWLATMAVLVNDGHAERAVARVLGEQDAGLLLWLRKKYPPPTFPSSLKIEWAEGPWELLVPQSLPEHTDMMPFAAMLPGIYVFDDTVRRLRDCAIEYHRPLHELVGPPVWCPWLGQAVPMALEIPGIDASGQSERGKLSLAEVSSSVAALAAEYINFSLVEPIFGVNPLAWQMAMCEHGLFPVAGDAERIYVFRYNPEPILTPSWLVGMSM